MGERTPVEELAKGTVNPDGKIEGAWLDAFLDLTAAGLHWKKAAFVAWDNAPKNTRQPQTMRDLAELLNYKSEQAFYKWRKQDWYHDIGIEQYRRSIFGKHLADVDRATIGAALVETGSPGVQARKLFYELAGVINSNRAEASAEDEADEWWLMAAEDEQPTNSV